MNYNLTIYTRSKNPDLYNKMRSLLPSTVECIRCDQFQEWWQASDYLHYILTANPTTDYAINIDEDCFVKDWAQVESLMGYMADNGYDYAGMPDGGVCPHRSRSWVVMNPFFNVFHVERILPVINAYPKWVINSCGFNADWHTRTPDIVKGAYSHDYAEPFSSLFYFLYDKFRPLYLNAYGHNDGTSTLLHDHEGKIMAAHAWYSREFAHDVSHRNRILSLFNEVKNG